MVDVRIKAFGIPELMASLRNVGKRVPEAGRKAMHRGADRIISEARKNAPVDKHNLEGSIQKEISYGGAGRLQVDVVVGGVVNGVNVDDYAVEVHENYEDMGVGPGTEAKRRADPSRYIGEKFLDRAVDDQREKLMGMMIQAIVKEWYL